MLAAVAPARVLLAAGATAGALLVSGCGSGARQDAHEVARNYDMQILRASFPAKQSIAKPSQLEITVRNSGARTVPVVAVTLDSLNYSSSYPELADDKRPIWAVERGPGAVAKPAVESQEVSQLGDGGTAYVNTWALGPLPPHKAHTFLWKLVPVKSGTYTVTYTVAAGLSGKAKVRLASGAAPQGRFTVDIASAPAITQVDPNTGKVVPGTYP